MTEGVFAPFSARYGVQTGQIDNNFPETARNGLKHILVDLIERQYVSGWQAIAKELQRIARHPPCSFELNAEGEKQAQDTALNIIDELQWTKIYDFCERLYGHLAQEVGAGFGWDYQVIATKGEVQEYITKELKRLFLEEGLAYEFSDGVVRRRGRKHTAEVTAKAHLVLGDPVLQGARKHYETALQFFRSPDDPDYENCVKEAVCCVEAAAKALFPDSKATTLGDFANWLSNSKDINIPKALCKTITAIYAFRNGGDGISHGGGTGGKATKEVAEYILSISASQVIYLVDLANQEAEAPPF